MPMLKFKTHFIMAFYISIVFLIILVLCTPILQSTYAQLQANVTTNCQNENCTTTICVNNEPCKTTNSNSSNITSFGGLIDNGTVPKPTVPGEIV